jgi:predicted dehydrogenase
VRSWLIGTGPMGRDYYKVLQALGESVKVIGRGEESATKFESMTGQLVSRGTLEFHLEQMGAPAQAVVAVGIDNLAPVASAMIRAGTKRILLEKPGALNRHELAQLAEMAAAHGASVLLGYNRRFHAATLEAERLIAEDGGATFCVFEFTEWAHTITPLNLPKEVKENWMYSNSSHVADLAFFLSGYPREVAAFHGGHLDWHSKSARFAGAGITERGIFFSYHADWEAPGRWGVEVMTRKRRFIFRPLEKLQVIQLASTTIAEVPLNDMLDQEYKPGLYLQTQAFLHGEDNRFCNIDQQRMKMDLYAKMAGYSQHA